MTTPVLPAQEREASPTSTSLNRRHALRLSLVAVVIAYILWNVPQLDFLVYPLRLFVTYVHEAGHSLMALLTGGDVIGFSVSADGSGLATTRGGSRALILPAGYLGAAAFGALLFFVTNRLMRPRATAIVLGGGLIAFTLMFAAPDPGGMPIALFVGVISGAALIALGWRVKNVEVSFVVLNVLAIMTALNAFYDLLYIIRASDATVRTATGVIHNDAQAFSNEIAPVLPASAWAVIWAVIAVAIIAAAFWGSMVQPVLHDRAVNRFFDTQARVRKKPRRPDPASQRNSDGQRENARTRNTDPFPWETWDDQ